MDEIRVCAITTVEKRLDSAVGLARQLHNCSIIVDPGEMFPGATWNKVRTWKTVNTMSRDGWALVLEDDAILHPDFWARANAMLADCPTNVVGFYSQNWKSDPEHPAGEPWKIVGGAEYRPHVARAMRLPLVKDFIQSYYPIYLGLRAKWGATSGVFDSLQGDFLQERGEKVAIAMPNLVDHDPESESILGHNATFGGHPRKSYTFNADI
jgi:hypothetical protein